MTVPSATPLDYLLAEIERAIQARFYFLALTMVLALPDLCVSLVSPDGRCNGERYRKWCKENLTKGFEFVTGDDLFSMRCGVVHNGRFGDMKNNVARVIFALPGSVTFTNCKIDDSYVYSVADFCSNFIAAVRCWYSANAADANVTANLPRMMTLYPDGLAPYIKGTPILA
ncbi:hypothetical protein [Dongia mobilis]|uniref:hypothetical protein n=1 Tax=Dongia sp. TaxID=1977262 RepID=UPI0026EEDFFD